MLKKLAVLGIAFLMLFSLAGCPASEEDKMKGTFYSLQDAYDEELLTVEDLQSIAHYYNNGSDDASYAPMPKNPKTLSEKIENHIKETYRLDILDMPKASFERINIYEYYGTYNGSIAVGITDDYNAYDYISILEYNVGGIVFYDIHSTSIRIWCEVK